MTFWRECTLANSVEMKRSLGVFALISVAILSLSSVAFAAPGSFDMGTDSSYTEDDPAISVLGDFTLSDQGQDYTGGSVTFAIDGSNEAGEVLAFQEGTPSTVDDAISVQGGTVFKGNGTVANPIGNIDGTLDGDGNDLKVVFSNSFQNGDFSAGSTGWTITNSRVNMGYINGSGTVVPSTSTIAGFTPPIDYTWGPGASDSTQWDRTGAPNTFSSSTSGNLTMSVNGGSCERGYCVINGPYVVSDAAVYLSSGDSVSFTWAASAAGDAFNVYGYLVNTSSGKALKLIDETGRDSQSASGSVSATMGSTRNESGYFSSGTRRTDLKTYTAGTTTFTTGTSVYDDRYFTDGSAFTAGNYKFVFIAGTYDDSGGQYLGATFTIDNVTVSSAGGGDTVTAADIQALARLLTYSNSTGANATRSLTFSSSNSDTSSGTATTKTVSVTGSNDAPVLSVPSTITYTDTSAVDTFSNATRTLSATDEEGDSITFGIAGETAVAGTATKAGTYGTLAVTTAGNLTFTPNAAAINGLDTNAQETFTLTANDGNSSGTATLTVTITAVVDALASAPVVVSVTPGNAALTIVFTPPTSSGATPITNYKYSTDGTNYLALSPAQTISPLVITKLSVDGVSPLVNGTSYPITLKAVNTGGNSVASNSVAGVPANSSGTPTRRSQPIEPPPTPAPVLPPRITSPPVLPTPTGVNGPVITGGTPPTPPEIPQATVGGRPSAVTTETPSTTRLDMRAGRMAVAVQVPEQTGSVSRNPDGTAEVSVQKGASASLQGSGLRPGSFVQVFLPLSGDNAKELVSIPVGPDGSFDGAAPFATRPDERPLPVGRQVLQLVSLDADGNQVVVEMTVNIAQGTPAPEFNRIDGQIPEMAPGQSIATSGGEPVPVTVTPVVDQNLAVVEGEGWNMAINVDSEDGGVEPTEGGALLKLVRNDSATVAGEGFMPGTRADIWLFSEPTLLGTVTIAEDGTFTGDVNIDPNMVAVGEHTLQLQGVGEDGYVKAANLGVTVDDPVGQTPADVASASWSLLWWVLLIVLFLAVVSTSWWMWNRRNAQKVL